MKTIILTLDTTQIATVRDTLMAKLRDNLFNMGISNPKITSQSETITMEFIDDTGDAEANAGAVQELFSLHNLKVDKKIA